MVMMMNIMMMATGWIFERNLSIITYVHLCTYIFLPFFREEKNLRDGMDG